MKRTMGVILLLVCGFAFAESDLMSPEYWQRNAKVQFKDGKILASGKTVLLAAKPIRIEPDKAYRYTADLRKVAGKNPSSVHLALQLEDEKGRIILYHMAHAIPGTETVLAKPLKKGDKTLTVKDASKWQKNGAHVQYSVKADQSDLPNRNTFSTAIQSIEKNGENWTVTLKKPVSVSIPAGISVRQAPGSGFFILSSNWVGDKVLHVTSRPAGFKAGKKKEQLYCGAVYARVQLLLNWKNTPQDTVEISNLKLTEEADQ